jgi:hypothetical protein
VFWFSMLLNDVKAQFYVIQELVETEAHVIALFTKMEVCCRNSLAVYLPMLVHSIDTILNYLSCMIIGKLCTLWFI